MKKLALPVTLIALVGFLALAAEIPADKDVLTFQGKLGNVTFKHKEHATKGVTCVTCHHKTEGEAVPEPCSKCHMPDVEKEKAPKLKDAVHKTCQECHQKKIDAGEKAGPGKGAKECKGCHVKPVA